MSKHAANTASTTKKFLAAGGLAFGVASLGLFASAGTAAADGQNIPDLEPMGSNWGDPDGAEALDVSWAPAVEADDLSADSPHDNFWTHNNGPTNNNLPVASYPAAPSWPDNGWGVDDRG